MLQTAGVGGGSSRGWMMMVPTPLRAHRRVGGAPATAAAAEQSAERGAEPTGAELQQGPAGKGRGEMRACAAPLSPLLRSLSQTGRAGSPTLPFAFFGRCPLRYGGDALVPAAFFSSSLSLSLSQSRGAPVPFCCFRRPPPAPCWLFSQKPLSSISHNAFRKKKSGAVWCIRKRSAAGRPLRKRDTTRVFTRNKKTTRKVVAFCFGQV